MPDGPPPYRQYAGLALVILAYVGGILGWSWAVWQIESSSPPADSARAQAAHFRVAEAAVEAPPSPDSTRHATFERLLDRFVDAQGDVDYAALQRQAGSVLAPYLQTLADTRPSMLDREARLAFWINAYNAYTLKLIVDHYPVVSIRDIDGPSGGGTPFERPVGPVADTVRTLDEIEHEIIRERFDEPRIHFALVCAAKSCPRLRQEAYTGAQLDAQLDAQARRFLHDDQKNHIPAPDGTLALSRILKWYGEDFGPTPAALQRALASYFEGSVRDSLAHGAYTIRYRPYDWTLNASSLDRGNGDLEGAAGP